MRLKVAGTVHEVIRGSGDVFDVDGSAVPVRVEAVMPGVFQGRSDAGPAQVFLARDGDRIFAQVAGRAYEVRVVHKAATLVPESEKSGALEAPMPGRVTRIAVTLGDHVRRGQELLVVEAMKMENALVAPMDGVVKSLSVAVGDAVTPGPTLVVIEAGS